MNTQIHLFRYLRTLIPQQASLTEETARILNISTDSAYRRIRGEKPITFDELYLLCNHFRVSPDQILRLGEGVVLFNGKFVGRTFMFSQYLQDILFELKKISNFEKKELFIQDKDISIFHYFQFPELMNFKFFSWMKNQLPEEELKETAFSFDLIKPADLTIIREINAVYAGIPGVEMMNPDNILNDLRQIAYFRDTGVLNRQEDLDRIYSALDRMVEYLEGQAATGKKILYETGAASAHASYSLYVNDFFVGDNTILAVLNDTREVVLNHAAINFIKTSDVEFCEYTFDFMQTVIRKSTMISVVGEKSRTRFFNLLRERIEDFRMLRSKGLGNY
jgi:hypothetical protein